MRDGYKTVAGGGHFWPEISMSEGGSAARFWPPMSHMYLKFQVGIVRMDQWDSGDIRDG